MALALLTLYTHALLLCVLLLLTLQMASSSPPECGAPKKVINAIVNFQKPFSETNMQYIRYICQDGYKRQAGTTNLAICVFDSTTNKAYWKYGNISCIRDPLKPITMHSTLAPSTASGSSSSHDFTTSFTEGERFTTTPLSTATVKNLKKHPTPTTMLSQQTKFPGSASKTQRPTMVYHHTTERQSIHPAGSQSTTILPTTVGKTTMRTVTPQSTSFGHAATSRKMTQSDLESTYTSSDKTLSTVSYCTTTEHDSNIPGTSMWQKGKTAGSIAGVILSLIVLGIGIIIWKRPRNPHSPVPQTELNPEHSYPANHEEEEEESINL
ncbi:interleukin-15 receptor subunit alpha isoform X1 [Pyxicephalus adspersus]|uniref:interleukin-15 receptor subunit alpha isoform X1 n=1 Tax=Pyxicephalus adspersus TaxID=30357 RepID=UPI003B5CFCB3